MRATRPVRTILPDLITLIIFGEAYELWSPQRYNLHTSIVNIFDFLQFLLFRSQACSDDGRGPALLLT
jgi:hypothetical protein